MMEYMNAKHNEGHRNIPNYCVECPRIDFKGKDDKIPIERLKRQIYATGNKWQIENFEATHN